MIRIFCGEDTFTVHQSLQALVRDFAREHGLNTIVRLEGVDTRPAKLLEEVSAASLFSPHRLVILKNPSVNKELFGELSELIGQVPEGTTLVISDGSMDKRTKTYKALKASAGFKEFALPSQGQLEAWVTREVESRGGEISGKNAKLLVERAGRDQWQLNGDIEKLLAHNPQITEEAIEALVVPNLETSAFALLDAVMAGNTQECQKLLAQMKARSDPYELFGLLVWQMQALSLVSSAPKGMTSAELAKETGLKPFVLQKSQGLARSLGFEKIRQMVEQIATLDMQLKSTGVDPWLLVEQALAKIMVR